MTGAGTLARRLPERTGTECESSPHAPRAAALDVQFSLTHTKCARISRGRERVRRLHPLCFAVASIGLERS